MIEIGRVCVKTAGRESGRFCVVVKKVDDNFVLVTGPKSITKVKRRRCNTDHLLALSKKISISSDAPDSDVEQLLKKGNMLEEIQAEAEAAASHPDDQLVTDPDSKSITDEPAVTGAEQHKEPKADKPKEKKTVAHKKPPKKAVTHKKPKKSTKTAKKPAPKKHSAKAKNKTKKKK